MFFIYPYFHDKFYPERAIWALMDYKNMHSWVIFI